MRGICDQISFPTNLIYPGKLQPSLNCKNTHVQPQKRGNGFSGCLVLAPHDISIAVLSRQGLMYTQYNTEKCMWLHDLESENKCPVLVAFTSPFKPVYFRSSHSEAHFICYRQCAEPSNSHYRRDFRSLQEG